MNHTIPPQTALKNQMILCQPTQMNRIFGLFHSTRFSYLMALPWHRSFIFIKKVSWQKVPIVKAATPPSCPAWYASQRDGYRPAGIRFSFFPPPTGCYSFIFTFRAYESGRVVSFRKIQIKFKLLTQSMTVKV